MLCCVEGQSPRPHPLFLLLSTDVAPDIGPGDVLWPPDGLAALLAPAWLPPACGVLQHLWDEGTQLGLGTRTRGGKTEDKTFSYYFLTNILSLRHT